MSNGNKPQQLRVLQEEHRERIAATLKINRMIDHYNDVPGVNMSATQLKAGEILLKKILPDLKQIEHGGKIEASVTIIASADDLNL